jgi:hypothetical protein
MNISVESGSDFEQTDSYLVMPYSTITGDANIYRDPEVFRPERFETEAKGPCENVSFGAGRHPCTGKKVIYFIIFYLNVVAVYPYENGVSMFSRDSILLISTAPYINCCE